MFDILDDHFTNLDNVAVSAEVIFRSEHDKGRYETLLMYAYRKYKAANYHFGNVRRFIEEETSRLEEDDELGNILGGGKEVQVTFKVTRTADEYIYELSAFLEALKSSLDLLAEVCSCYLPGITTNYSISPLLKLVDKGKTGPIIDEIAANSAWLKSLREYRHHLVHRLMPSVRSGYETRRVGKHAAKVRYPVVVPESTPPFVVDTRASRMMAEIDDGDNGLPGLYCRTSMAEWQKPDGTEEVIRFSLDVGPSLGYKAIDEFMKSHLDNYERFFGQVIRAFERLQFKAITSTKTDSV